MFPMHAFRGGMELGGGPQIPVAVACGSLVRWSRALAQEHNLYHQCYAGLQTLSTSFPTYEMGISSIFLLSAPARSFLGA